MANALRISELVTPYNTAFINLLPSIKKCIEETPNDRDTMLVYSWFKINANDLEFVVNYLAKCIQVHITVSSKNICSLIFRRLNSITFVAPCYVFLNAGKRAFPCLISCYN